jgi:hypothetical protein
VAERSTATSPPQRPATARETSVADTAAAPTAAPAKGAAADTVSPRPPELHSGHRLAKRYRLEECITRLDGFSSWRAVDEKLRRAVGVHVLPADHERAPAVLAAARSSALLGDPRFVQVLDAVEQNDQVHIIHEWLPGATPLSTLLQSGPLDAYEAFQLASQVSQALAAAHREGLAHLRLTPATVLRTGPSQYRIRGLAVDAALRGITSPAPERTDTEAIGALLYAALTQRWPYPEGAHGLRGVVGLGKGRDALATPEQVRAGVHRGLSELAMRALVNDGATAASQSPPCTSPAELAEELAKLPRIPPSDPTPTQLPAAYGNPQRPAAPGRGTASSGPPALPGRTGTALKWGVSALLIVALGLGSWQLADVLHNGESAPESTETSAPPPDTSEEPPPPEPVSIAAVSSFDPEGSPVNEENSEAASYAIDGDPDTSWHTENYYGPSFGNLKPGVGLILDLGEPQEIRSLSVSAIGETQVEFRAAASDATSAPASLDAYTRLDQATGEDLTLDAGEPVETRFVLVWLTELPQGDDGNYRGRITDIGVFR